MNLIYHKKFWSFYKLNRQLINGFVAHMYKEYWIPCDFNEFLHQVLIKLHENNILEKFDESKSSLKTYILNQVRWHTGHVIHEYKAANKLQPADSSEVLTPDPESFEAYLEASELEEKIGEGLSRTERKILSLMKQGYNQREISSMYKVKLDLIRKHVRKIRTRTEVLTQKEAVHA